MGASLALATSGPEPTTVAVAEVDDAGVADYRTLAQLVRREFGHRLMMVDPNIRPALASDPRYQTRRGGSVRNDSRARVRVRARFMHVVDTIGAGGAFGAAVHAWLHNRDGLRPDLRVNAEQLESLLAFACSVASLTCARAGAEPPWRSEFDWGA